MRTLCLLLIRKRLKWFPRWKQYRLLSEVGWELHQRREIYFHHVIQSESFKSRGYFTTPQLLWIRELEWMRDEAWQTADRWMSAPILEEM